MRRHRDSYAEECPCAHFDYWNGDPNPWRCHRCSKPMTVLNIDGTSNKIGVERLREESKFRTAAQKEDQARTASQASTGVPIDFVVAFTFAHNCWDWPTRDVVRDIIKPATAETRCRYTDLLKRSEAYAPGPATVFCSHAWSATWGDIVAAISCGAHRDRMVWLDVFSVRQWPGNDADLDCFPTVIEQCKALILCNSPVPDINNPTEEGQRSITTRRVWCLAEIGAALKSNIPLFARVGHHKKDSHDVVSFESHKDTALGLFDYVKVEDAVCTVIRDRERIVKQIRDGKFTPILEEFPDADHNPEVTHLQKLIDDVTKDGKVDHTAYLENKIRSALKGSLHLQDVGGDAMPFALHKDESTMNWRRKTKAGARSSSQGIAVLQAAREAARQQAEFQEAFSLFDMDKSGSVDAKELGSLMGLLGFELSDEQIQDLIVEVDLDGSNQIEFEEFLVIMTRYRQEREQDIEDTFNILDANGNGFVTFEELKSTLAKTGHRFTSWELGAMTVSRDSDNDNQLNLEEFRHAYGKLGFERVRNLGELLAELRTVWELLDSNRDDNVDVEEIIGVFMQLGIHVPRSEAERILHEADEDGTGGVSQGEFLCAYHSESWKKFRLLGSTKARLAQLKKRRDNLYAAWQKNNERRKKGHRRFSFSLASGSTPEGTDDTLMVRGSLYRHVDIRSAIANFWRGIGRMTDVTSLDSKDERRKDRVNLALFKTYYVKIALIVHEGEDDFDGNAAVKMAEEEFEALCEESSLIMVSTTQDERYELKRTLSIESVEDVLPESVMKKTGSLSYSHFYDSIFKVADTLCESDDKITSDGLAKRYAEAINHMHTTLVIHDQGQCRWRDPSYVFTEETVWSEVPADGWDESSLVPEIKASGLLKEPEEVPSTSASSCSTMCRLM